MNKTNEDFYNFLADIYNKINRECYVFDENFRWRPITTLESYHPNKHSVTILDKHIKKLKIEIEELDKKIEVCTDYRIKINFIEKNSGSEIIRVFNDFKKSSDEINVQLQIFNSIIDQKSGGGVIYNYEKQINVFLNNDLETNELPGNDVHFSNKNIEIIKLCEAKIEHFKKITQITIKQFIIFRRMFNNLFYNLLHDVIGNSINLTKYISVDTLQLKLQKYESISDKYNLNLFLYKYFTKLIQYILKKYEYNIDKERRTYINIFFCDNIIKYGLRIMLLHENEQNNILGRAHSY